MKKLTAVLLALCLGCMLIPAMAGGDIAGTWYLTRAASNGAEISIGGSAINMTFDLREDGTAVMDVSAYGQTQTDTGSWSVDGDKVIIKDSTGAAIEAKYENGELVFEISGATMYMSKEEPEAADTSLPEAIPAISVGQFDGEWVISKVIAMGMVASAGDLGMDSLAQLKIENGKMIETTLDAATGERTETAYDAEFKDGKLVVSMQVEGVDVVIAFSLLVDGSLCGNMTISMSGVSMDIQMLYIPADQAAEQPAA